MANIIKWSLKEKTIRYLIENKGTPHSILEISKKLNSDYKNTFQVIRRISPDIIVRDKFGNATMIEIKLNPRMDIYSVENRRIQEFLSKNPRIKLIKKDIEDINYPFFIVLIFGSYAKKTEDEKSDIDLCIISDRREKTKELISKIGLLSLPVEIHDFSFDEFESMLKTREPNVAHEIVKNNFILYGIENYYNLISKWMKKD
jgi:predicted nucleotidyltransferase